MDLMKPPADLPIYGKQVALVLVGGEPRYMAIIDMVLGVVYDVGPEDILTYPIPEQPSN